MVSLTQFKSFRDTLSLIHTNTQEMATQNLKLEPYLAETGQIDDQTYVYKLSDLDNTLKRQFSDNLPEITLSSGVKVKLNELGRYESEYLLEDDSCPIQKIIAGLTEFGGELELCLYLTFKEDIDEDLILKDSDFNRLMA